MKVEIVDLGTKEVRSSYNQSVNSLVPNIGDEIDVDGASAIVVGRQVKTVTQKGAGHHQIVTLYI